MSSDRSGTGTMLMRASSTMRSSKAKAGAKWMLAVLALLLAASLALFGNWPGELAWRMNPRADALEKAARKVSSWGTVDCGWVDSGSGVWSDSAEVARECTVAAFKAHRPFRVRYDKLCFLSGFGSIRKIGTSDGRVYSLSLSPEGILRQTLYRNPFIEMNEGKEHLKSR